MTFKWTRQIMQALLKEYKKFENLYNLKHRDYANRVKRQNALEHVASKLRSFNGKITAGDVRSKFQTIRSQFARELRQAIKSKREGDIYIPRLWCYDYLTFLIPYCSIKAPITYVETNTEFRGRDSPSCSELENERNQPGASKGKRLDSSAIKHEHIDSHATRITRDYDSNSEDIADPLDENVHNHGYIDPHAKNRITGDYDSNSEDREDALVENREQINYHNQKSIKGPNSEDRGDTLVGKVHNVESQRDDHQIFGDYVASEFRSLRYDHNRRLLRLKMQRAILEVADIDNRDANAKISNLANLLPSSTSVQLKEGYQESEPQEQLICITGI